MIPKVGVVMFPGLNCESETMVALKSVGMDARIVRWNELDKLSEFDGYVIPGGWSFEDRIRAGVIAAKDPVMDLIREESEKGKPVLGICNGAQILVESGLIPGVEDRVQFGLAPSKYDYKCIWTKIKSVNKKGSCAFNSSINENEIIPVPIAHGEGWFITKEKDLLDDLIQHRQIVFRYCNQTGEFNETFPTNPNGSTYNIAALSNPRGNVMAIMPHPERASFVRQLPDLQIKRGSCGNFEKMESATLGIKIFESMKSFIQGRAEK